MKNYTYIFKKKSAVHGSGIFAKTFIPKGTKVVEYVGEKITKAEANKRGPKLIEYAKKYKEQGAVYIFELNSKYDIDGHVSGNIAKYINHSCDPNCEVEIIRGHIWIVALKDIAKGAELFYNYGYDDLKDFRDHPCYCGSPSCAGYILAEVHWPKLRKILLKTMKVDLKECKP